MPEKMLDSYTTATFVIYIWEYDLQRAADLSHPHRGFDELTELLHK